MQRLKKRLQAVLNTPFESLEGFPEGWKTNLTTFIEFVRETTGFASLNTPGTRLLPRTKSGKPVR
jgi:hypothetical protein